MKKDKKARDSFESTSELISQKDWSQTPLGPIKEWPPELRIAVNIMLKAEEAIGIFWGEEPILLYNDRAREQIGAKHPKALGQRARDVFPEAWDTLGPIHRQVITGKGPVRVEDKYVPLERNGELEDIRWNSSFNPIPLADGSVGGVFNISVDITAPKQAELKREHFLLKLSDVIRPLSDPIKIQNKAARIVGEHFHLDRAHFGEVLSDEDTNIVYADYHQENMMSLIGKHQLSDFDTYIRKNFLTGNTIVVNDFTSIEGFTDEERAAYQKLNITALLGIPLLKDGQLRAYFRVTQSKPREWSALEVQMIEETAKRTWAAVEQARAEQKLQKSEKQLDVFIKATSDIIYRMSPDWLKMYSLDGRGLIIDTDNPREHWLKAYIPEEEQLRVKAAIIEAIKTKSIFELEHQVLQIDGTKGWISSRAIPILDRNEDIIEWFGTATDITERKEMEEALRESEECLQMAQDTAQLGYWELNTNTKTFTCSSICKAHFGRADDESLTYEEIIEAIHPSDWKNKKRVMQNALEAGKEYKVEYRINWPNGTQRWIYTRAQCLSDTELTGVTLDITERKKIEEKLEQRTRALQTSRMKLRSLVNKLSRAEENQRYIIAGELHDNLGQLLDVCKLKFDLWLKNNGQKNFPAINEIRDLIKEASKCTRRLVNDLKPTPTEEKKELDSALKWVAGKMEKHGLVVDIKNSQPQTPVDQPCLNTLVQSVQELLFNIVKHAETDQAWLIVTKSNDFVQIRVKDKGKGFDPEQLEESDGQEGFGLFNVRQRIDLLGGTLTIDSVPGNGTAAIIQMPIKNDQATDRTPDLKESNADPVLTSTTLIRVMVVDDHQMMREGIAGIINAEEDMLVTNEAATGEDAISMVDKVQPDVVIMDINLPGINGIEATREIKGKYPNTQIIGISFLKDQELLNNILDAGATDFISKDETLQSLCRAIREAVN